MPGFPVHHQLPELAQTHVHWLGDIIQPSHPLSFPSPPALNLSQHQGIFQWVSSLHQVAKVLELQLQHQSCQQIFRSDSLELTDLISLQSKGLSRVFSNTTVQKHQFFGAQLSSFVLVSFNNLEMIWGIWENVHSSLYANTATFYIRSWAFVDFGIHGGFSNHHPNSQDLIIPLIGCK